MQRIAFDLDGTLIDARIRQVGVAEQALREVAGGVTGERLDARRFWAAKRAGATTLEALLRLGYAPELADAAAVRWGELIESDGWLDRDRALQGARRALTACPGAVVITARMRPDGARRSLKAAGIAELVGDLIVVSPRAAAVEKAQALRRCRASLFVGDTESDGAAALAAGMPFAAVSTGQRSARHLRERGFTVFGSLGSALSAAATPVR